MPWKNGLGLTTQLAIHPPGATTETFDWRISIAQLQGSAAFSKFVGIERILVMLEGEMALLREGHTPITLTPQSAPVSFSGNVAATGRVEQGSALDLNLMYRPSVWRATMRRVSAAAGATIGAQATALLCVLAAARVGIDGERFEMEALDLLRTEREVQFDAVSALDAYVIELRAQSA
jgi:uncharacterized protein